MGESSSKSSSIMNLPVVDSGIPPLRRTESSVEDCPISDKDAPLEELLKRLHLLVNSRPPDSMRSHLPVPFKKEVNNIIDLLRGKSQQPTRRKRVQRLKLSLTARKC
ncbi:hypothetical protein AVEN_69172-1 [Araneus ventricosus]|uniref:Uncharacterized protein n=1 Tax=Araneus ventricosus TaxID=182803 RepID=A0A4Y2FWD6_ARAVE|nr:hypothetical protein AVEN_191393-1 [Araneus ventricosus]GBM45317.1 hypothetical protein AVEN_69172-1 [Araneus ventricosus]